MQKFRELGFENYNEYLESPHWQKVRERRFEGNRNCQRRFCPRKARLTHHLSYENLGNEKKGELVDICQTCHYDCHYLKDHTRIPLTKKRLVMRWSQMNSVRWNLLRLRASDVFAFIGRMYRP